MIGRKPVCILFTINTTQLREEITDIFAMLSVSSKIMESWVADTLTRHAFKDIDLVTDKQWVT